MVYYYRYDNCKNQIETIMENPDRFISEQKKDTLIFSYFNNKILRTGYDSIMDSYFLPYLKKFALNYKISDGIPRHYSEEFRGYIKEYAVIQDPNEKIFVFTFKEFNNDWKLVRLIFN